MFSELVTIVLEVVKIVLNNSFLKPILTTYKTMVTNYENINH